MDYVEQLGEVQLAYVDTGRKDEPLVVKTPGNTRIERGKPLRLSADPGNLHIFDPNGRAYSREQPAMAAE